MTNQRVCPKCGGSGEITRFNHYAKGVCFLCKGKGLIQASAIVADDIEQHEPPEPNTNDVPEWVEAYDNERD